MNQSRIRNKNDLTTKIKTTLIIVLINLTNWIIKITV